MSRNLRLVPEASVVTAVSAVGEERWGFHQFPNLSRFPDGGILLTWADAADCSETHGQPAPALVSRDEGRTWAPYPGDPRPLRPHYSMSPVYDGEYLVMPAQAYLDITAAGVTMPAAVSEADTYGIVRHYRIGDFPPVVQDYFQHLPAQRWSPRTQQWAPATVTYDLDGLFVWKRDQSNVLPRTFFERPLLRLNGELLYADYRVRYALADGTASGKGGSTLMVSTDNGRSFRRRATIAVDPSGRDLYGEPQLSLTADGRLVCVIRKTDQNQKPMAITWSADAGRTWTPPRPLGEFGVWPCVLLLGCGALVLSYGRPGVHLRVDAAGTGEQWAAPTTLIAGDAAARHRFTCGYTSLLPVADRAFLIAYSDFAHCDAAGATRKAILVRRINVAD